MAGNALVVLPALGGIGGLVSSLLVTNLAPAQWSKATAGYKGPYLSYCDLKATPINSPFRAKDKVPLFMFRQIPRIPCFLNRFPY